MLKRLFRRTRKPEGPDTTTRPPSREDIRPKVVPEPSSRETGGSGAAQEPDPPSGIPAMSERVQTLLDRFADEMNDVEELLRGLHDVDADLPQPPLAAQAALRVLNRPDYNLDELTGHLEKDPALSQTLLRHANSPWYGGSSENPIAAIRPAVQRVGGNGVHAAIMQHFVSGEMLRPGPGLNDLARLVWQHMVRTAPTARELARVFKADPDRTFTVALLHDVGKLALLDHIGRIRKRLRRDLHLAPEFVSAALTLLHEPLGEAAALAWGMPRDFAAVIGSHHRRGPAPEGPLSEVVYLAERLDILGFRSEKPDLEEIWTEGRLTGPREDVEEWLAQRGG